jgi:hypothetical protein
VAKSPTEQIRELERIVIAQQQQLIHVQRELDELRAVVREAERLATSMGQELSSHKTRSEEQSKRLDEWDRRNWSMVALLVGAALALASGLIAALAKK